MTRLSAACGGSGYWHQRADVVVIGTGVAGLVAALAAHRRGRKVVVLSKASETATFYAQGGIAVVLPDALREGGDSVDAHVADTLAAQVGSWRFLIVQTVVLVGWISANVIGWIVEWDPYPFILLNLLLSF